MSGLSALSDNDLIDATLLLLMPWDTAKRDAVNILAELRSRLASLRQERDDYLASVADDAGRALRAEARARELEADLNVERMRLAACGVVALGNTPESAAKARDFPDEYRSASCDDVAAAVDREMAYRDRVAVLEAALREIKSVCEGSWRHQQLLDIARAVLASTVQNEEQV